MTISASSTASEVTDILASMPRTRDAVIPTVDLIKAMLDAGPGVSDLVFSPGRPPQVEQHGELLPVDVPELPVLRSEDTAIVDGGSIRPVPVAAIKASNGRRSVSGDAGTATVPPASHCCSCNS